MTAPSLGLTSLARPARHAFSKDSWLMIYKSGALFSSEAWLIFSKYSSPDSNTGTTRTSWVSL
jgi:hypothetical protein